MDSLPIVWWNGAVLLVHWQVEVLTVNWRFTFLNHEHKITFLNSCFFFLSVLSLLPVYFNLKETKKKKKTFIIPLVILLILSFFLRFIFWQMCTPSVWGKITFIIPLIILLICLLFFRLLFLQMCTPSLWGKKLLDIFCIMIFSFCLFPFDRLIRVDYKRTDSFHYALYFRFNGHIPCQEWVLSSFWYVPRLPGLCQHHLSVGRLTIQGYAKNKTQ